MTFKLAGERIAVQGFIGHGNSDTFSVVGGTGAYAGARGTVLKVGTKASTNFTFSLL